MVQHPVILHLPTAGDISSLCCSSISETSSAPLNKEKKKKVVGKRYSRLAFTVQKAVARNDSDVVSVASLDSSLSSHDLIYTKDCPVSFEKNFIASRGGEEKKKKTMKKFFERKKDISNNQSIPLAPTTGVELTPRTARQCSAIVSIGGDDKKTKVSQKKYSRLAFSVHSVQQVGSTVKKRKKTLKRFI